MRPRRKFSTAVRVEPPSVAAPVALPSRTIFCAWCAEVVTEGKCCNGVPVHNGCLSAYLDDCAKWRKGGLQVTELVPRRVSGHQCGMCGEVIQHGEGNRYNGTPVHWSCGDAYMAHCPDRTFSVTAL